MATLQVAVRCPRCGEILLFFEQILPGTSLTCDACHTQFPFSADRIVPESELAAATGAGSQQAGTPVGRPSSAHDGSSDEFVFHERPIWPLLVLGGVALVIGLLIGAWAFKRPDDGKQIARPDASSVSKEASKPEPPKAAAPTAPPVGPPAPAPPSPPVVTPSPPVVDPPKDEPRKTPPPPPVTPPPDGKDEGKTELPPRPVVPPDPGMGTAPPIVPPVVPPMGVPGGGGGGGGGGGAMGGGGVGDTNIELNLNLFAQDAAQQAALEALPGVIWNGAVVPETGEEWGLWTDNAPAAGSPTRDAHLRIRTTRATTERVTIELTPDSDLTIVSPGSQLTFQGGNAWQEVTVRGNATAAFGGLVSKTSRIRTAVTREGGERRNGPEIPIVILDNTSPQVVFMPMTVPPFQPNTTPPICVRTNNGSRGLGFRVVATQQPAAGVTVVLTPAGASVPPGAYTGACDPPAPGGFVLDATNYVHGRQAHPPEGTATPGTYTINYAYAAAGGFPAHAASAAVNVRNGAGTNCPGTATPQVASRRLFCEIGVA